jgi:hypothetical protein
MWKRLALAFLPSVAAVASLLVAPETAQAQAVKPRFTLILDTSSSMVENPSGTATFGDGSTGYEGCDRDNMGAYRYDDSRLYQARAPSPTPSPPSARRSSRWPGSAAATWARPAPPTPSATPSPLAAPAWAASAPAPRITTPARMMAPAALARSVRLAVVSP